MKITFETGSGVCTEQNRGEPVKGNRGAESSGRGNGHDAVRVDLFRGGAAIREKNARGKSGLLRGGAGQDGEKEKTAEDIRQDAQHADAKVMQDYMTVMSHTMSDEDYAKLQEDGFHFQSMDPRAAVTILDRIKIELARSGQEITGYTDTIDMDTLTEAVGSRSLAQSIAQGFAQADIPLTPKNVDMAKQAVEMASQLSQPGDGEYHYMVDNCLEPDIQSFYLAENSGAGEADRVAREQGRQPGFYADEVEGYYSRSAQADSAGHLDAQIDKVIADAGLKTDQETRAAAAWLVERGVPLNAENLQRLLEIRSVAFPVEPGYAAHVAANAIAEGRMPAAGRLSDAENIYQKAVKYEAAFFSEQLYENSSLAARRQLEEIRLRMTAEVNVKLLKSGFSIDTAPMEELIEALKQAEAQVAGDYFPGDAAAVEKYRQFHRTCNMMEDIPGFPASLLGGWSSRMEDGSLEEFHREGKARQDTYQRAGESYEALMTSPRSDMGDSIKKAFANVDDILTDLGLECSDQNRKAARILGYNQMAITPENLASIKAAEAQVNSVTEKMTPASILKMIRDGVNPLQKSLTELEDYFAGQSEEVDGRAESYSRFLYGLECDHAITQPERDSFIGVYRLLHQLEVSDGAAVGALVNSQTEVNFKNLLTAVRSSKAKHMNVLVNDSLGTLEALVEKGVSISEQIAQGYGKEWKDVLTDVSYSEESAEAYQRQQLQELRQMCLTDRECMTMLRRGGIPVNMENLLAAQTLNSQPGAPFRRWLERKNTSEEMDGTGQTEDMTDTSKASGAEELWQKLDTKEQFREDYQRIVEDLEKQAEESILEEADTYMEVRELQLIHKQLYTAGKLAASEEYFIPMNIDGEMTGVHLIMERNGGQKGSVRASVNLDDLGRVEGRFHINDGRISGYFIGNTPEAVTKLQTAADIFHNSASEEWELESLEVTTTLPKQEPVTEHVQGDAANDELYRAARYFLSAIKAM